MMNGWGIGPNCCSWKVPWSAMHELRCPVAWAASAPRLGRATLAPMCLVPHILLGLYSAW